MNKRIIMIPLGGIGERFKQNGYEQPKALIRLFSKPILNWLLDNIKSSNRFEEIEYVYIPYNKEYDVFRFEDVIKKEYPDIKFRFLQLHKDTEGASETIMISLNNILSESDKPILCLDSDNFYLDDIIGKWDGDNSIYTFRDTSELPIFSYVTSSSDNVIIDIVEKRKISNDACTGAYAFSSFHNLHRYCKLIVDNNIRQNGEYYTSTAIKKMLEDGVTFNKIPYVGT